MAIYRQNAKLPVKRNCLAESLSFSFEALGPWIGLRPIYRGRVAENTIGLSLCFGNN
jgi:hypothetical protein